MVAQDLLRQNRLDEVTRLAAEAVALAAGVRGPSAAGSEGGER